MKEFYRRHKKVLDPVILTLAVVALFAYFWFLKTQCGLSPSGGYHGP